MIIADMNAQFNFLGQQGISIPGCVSHTHEFEKTINEFNDAADEFACSKKHFGVFSLDGVHSDVVEGLTKLCSLMGLTTRVRKIHGHQLLQFGFV